MFTPIPSTSTEQPLTPLNGTESNCTFGGGLPGWKWKSTCAATLLFPDRTAAGKMQGRGTAVGGTAGCNKMPLTSSSSRKPRTYIGSRAVDPAPLSLARAAPAAAPDGAGKRAALDPPRSVSALFIKCSRNSATIRVYGSTILSSSGGLTGTMRARVCGTSTRADGLCSKAAAASLYHARATGVDACSNALASMTRAGMRLQQRRSRAILPLLPRRSCPLSDPPALPCTAMRLTCASR
jgi:hypothetical protein